MSTTIKLFIGVLCNCLINIFFSSNFDVDKMFLNLLIYYFISHKSFLQYLKNIKNFAIRIELQYFYKRLKLKCWYIYKNIELNLIFKTILYNEPISISVHGSLKIIHYFNNLFLTCPL